MIAIIRSIIFNVLFYGLTLSLCIVYLPFLLLPRDYYIDAVHFWLHCVQFLERYVLGLKLEIKGLEHLPKEGPYLIAAKHQSAYETFKLHLLFDDPAIILKKELLKIPLWGLHLSKADVIAIDRSTPEKALKSIEEGALRVTKAGRPIVIFPQGTRVKPAQSAKDKTYKPGIARIQDVTSLPIIPLALNSGYFWPKNSFFKKPGTVTFEFLKPIHPGKKRKELLAELEEVIETNSNQLGKSLSLKTPTQKSLKPYLVFLICCCIALFGIYTALWFESADAIKKQHKIFLSDISQEPSMQDLVVSGYPGAIRVVLKKEKIVQKQGSLHIENLEAVAWPIPYAPINITAEKVKLTSYKWDTPLELKDFKARLRVGFEAYKTSNKNILFIDEATISGDPYNYSLELLGSINIATKQTARSDFALRLRLYNYKYFIDNLSDIQAIDVRMALFGKAALAALQNKEGFIELPLENKENVFYLGQFPIGFYNF